MEAVPEPCQVYSPPFLSLMFFYVRRESRAASAFLKQFPLCDPDLLKIQGIPEHGWKSDWENRRALVPSHSSNQSGIQQYSGTALGRLQVRLEERLGKPMGLFFEPFLENQLPTWERQQYSGTALKITRAASECFKWT